MTYSYLLLFCAVACVLWVPFLLNLRNLLLAIDPQNRKISPGQVWLNFIPIFNLYWLIRTVTAVGDSARSEFQSRGWYTGGDFSCGIGLAMAKIYIVNAVFYFACAVSFLAGGVGGIVGTIFLGLAEIAGLAAFILWIIYWAKANSVKNQLTRALLPPPPMANPAYPVYGAAPVGYHPPQYGGQPVYQQPPPPQWPQPQQPWQQPQPMPPQPAQWQPTPPLQAVPQAATQWASSQQSPSPAVGQVMSSACGACGSALSSDAAFCGACGMPIPKKQDS